MNKSTALIILTGLLFAFSQNSYGQQDEIIIPPMGASLIGSNRNHVDLSLLLFEQFNYQEGEPGTEILHLSRKQMKLLYDEINAALTLNRTVMNDVMGDPRKRKTAEEYAENWKGTEHWKKRIADGIAMMEENSFLMQRKLVDLSNQFLDQEQLKTLRALAVQQGVEQQNGSYDKLIQGTIHEFSLKLTPKQRLHLQDDMRKIKLEYRRELAKLRIKTWEKIESKIPKEIKEKTDNFLGIEGLGNKK